MRPRRETYWHSRKPERQGETLGLERLWIGALGGMACMYTCYTHVTRMLMACMYTCYTHVTPMWMACMYTSYTQVHRVHILQCTTQHISHTCSARVHILHTWHAYINLQNEYDIWVVISVCMRVWYVCVCVFDMYVYAIIACMPMHLLSLNLRSGSNGVYANGVYAQNVTHTYV